MKLLAILCLFFTASFLGGCQTSPVKIIKPSEVQVSGPIEITSYKTEKTSSDFCSVQGTLVDENGETMIATTVKLFDTQLGASCDFDGKFKIGQIPPGNYTLEFTELGVEKCTVKIELNAGDKLTIEGIIARHVDVQLLKPIVYIYPEKKMDVQVQLNYDGKLTTTYPKYPENGWTVNAEPDGTLIDENGREYYSLYWEGDPRKPLGIKEGFVVSKMGTIDFLEEKLELLGLNAKEANEFIIFWLPVLEKNEFNLISFAGEKYLEQAELKVSPKPDTEIRICMVFQGLEEEIDFPIQDIGPLEKTRKGFTVVEWGGQELPKKYNLTIN